MMDFFYDSYSLILKFLIPGVFLGIVYDVFRLFRIGRNDKTHLVFVSLKRRFGWKSSRTKKRHISDVIWIFIEDILFFLIAAITEILVTYHLNGGEFRIYSLLLSLIGFFIYQKTVGNLLIYFSKKLLYLFRKIMYGICVAILLPCVAIGKIFRKILTKFRKVPLKEENTDLSV